MDNCGYGDEYEYGPRQDEQEWAETQPFIDWLLETASIELSRPDMPAYLEFTQENK